MKRVHAFIEGRVQGVFYRAFARDSARALGLSGWVRNLADGRVEAVFEGEEEKIEKMLAFLKKGPPYAVVKNLEVEEEEYKGEFRGFAVVY